MGGAYGAPATRRRPPSGTSTATRRRRRSSSPRGARPARPTRRSRGRWPSVWTSPSGRRILPDHVVGLARRAGSTPDDSIALSQGEARWRPLGGEQPGRPLRRRRAPLLHGVPRPLRRLLRRVHPRPARARRRLDRSWSTEALPVDVEPRPAHGRETVADWRRLTGGRRTSTWRSRPTASSSTGSSIGSGGWRRPGRTWHASAGQRAAATARR